MRVGRDATATLDAGDHGAITVATGGTLIFTGGIYNLQSLQAGPGTQLLFQSPAELRVAGQLRTEADTFIGPAPGVTTNPPTAAHLVVFVAGKNGRGGLLAFPDTLPSAVTLGERNAVHATVWALNGTVHLLPDTDAEGALWGRDVWLEERVQLGWNSFFANTPRRRTASGWQWRRTPRPRSP